ncbi:MAG: hemerythrin domain-containing protein [Candidatus Kerfeldbacteria bacterium]
MKKNLITTLVAQHRELQNNLKCVADQLKIELPEISKINECLEEFSVNLTEHLKLENDTFYVNLLKVMKEKGQDTTKTEKFIAEMNDIAIVVMEFLNKFKGEEKIKAQIDSLKNELPAIIDTLGLRIETEEAGVYAYWGLF